MGAVGIVTTSPPLPVRVGLVGAGYFAQFHLDAWQRIDDATLVAVVDRDEIKACASGVKAYTNLTDMIISESPDIIDIATPPPTHLDLIKDALGCGIKTIICQKPFCGDLKHAREALELGEAYNALIVVHENFRFQPWYRCIKSEMDAGAIGQVLHVTFRLRPGDGQGDDAYLARQPYFQKMERFLIHETGVHWIDTFRFLLGEPHSVYADLRQLNPVIVGEDAGFFVFGYKNGQRAIFDGNRLLDHVAVNRRLTMGECYVEGTEGELRLFGDGAVTLRQHGSNDTKTVLAPRPEVGFGGDCVRALQAHVVSAILNGTPVENDVASYVRNMALADAIYDSANQGQKIEVE